MKQFNLADLEYLAMKHEPFLPLEWVEHTNGQLRPNDTEFDMAVRIRYRAGGESMGYLQANNVQWHLVSEFAIPYAKFPNLALETLAKRDGKTNLIADFIEHLADRDIVLCRWESETSLAPCSISVKDLLCDYFQIDPKQVEVERTQLLEEFLKGHSGVPEVVSREPS